MTAPIAPIEPPNEEDATTVAIRRFWKWVVIQAVLEAGGHAMPDVDAAWKKHIRRAAQVWLTSESGDLREVCDNAGLNYRAVLAGARKKFGRGKYAKPIQTSVA